MHGEPVLRVAVSLPRGVSERLVNIFSLKIGVGGQRISFADRPAARSPTTVATVTRMPRMHAFPPMTSGLSVIRGNSALFILLPIIALIACSVGESVTNQTTRGVRCRD